MRVSDFLPLDYLHVGAGLQVRFAETGAGVCFFWGGGEAPGLLGSLAEGGNLCPHPLFTPGMAIGGLGASACAGSHFRLVATWGHGGRTQTL